MEKQIIFEYRVSGFFTDTVTTQEINTLQENATKNQNQWSLSNLFSYQNQPIPEETRPTIPWQISLAPSGNLVAFVQTGVLTIFDYETSDQKFLELSSSFCHSPEKRIIKWSPCSNYLFLLSSEKSLLILTSSGEAIGVVSDFGIPTSSPVREYFPFNKVKRENVSNLHEFFFHFILSNGDCYSLRVCLDDGSKFSVKGLCQLKLSQKSPASVEAASYLSHHNAILLVLKLKSSFGSNYQTCLQYVQYSESGSGQALTTVDFYPHSLLNRIQNLENSDMHSQPFVSICSDPIGRNIALLHSSGMITVIRYQPTPSARVTDIAELQNFENGKLKEKITSIHFLSESVLMTLSESGEVNIRSLTWIRSPNTSDEKSSFSFLSVNVSVESIPPVLGKSLASSIVYDHILNPTSELYSRVSVLRILDSWTCQLFTLTSVTPQHALETKIKEAYFTSAYSLADRIGVDADVVALAEWKYQNSQLEQHYLNGSHSVSDVGYPSIATTSLTKIKSLSLLLREILIFSSLSVELWISVLSEGIKRTQVFADKIIECLDSRPFDSSENNLLLKTLEMSNSSLTAIELSSIICSRGMIIEKYLKLLTFLALKDTQFAFIEFRDYLHLRSVEFNASSSDINIILQVSTRLLAEFLLMSQQYNLFKKILFYHPHQIFPHYFTILSHIPITADPNDYISLIPFPPQQEIESIPTCRYQWLVSFYEQKSISIFPAVDMLLEKNFSQNITYDVSSWDIVVTSLYLTEHEHASSMLFPVDLDNLHNGEKISRWALEWILRMESLGQTSHSIVFLNYLLDLNYFPSSQLQFFQELFLQLRHFSDIIYHQLCPLAFTFLDWLVTPLDQRMRILFENSLQMQLECQHSSIQVPNIDFVDVINLYITSVYLGDNQSKQITLYSYLSCSEFITHIAQYVPNLKNSSPQRLHEIIQKIEFTDELETSLLKELIQTIQLNTFGVEDRERKDLAMENLCRVIDTSKPGYPENQKCIKKLSVMLQLVIESCRTYNTIDRCGLDFMWRMIESTPTTENTKMNDQQQQDLDRIQSALSVGEILCDYFPDTNLPSLNSLIPLTSSHRHEQQIFQHKYLIGLKSYYLELNNLMNITTISDDDNDDDGYGHDLNPITLTLGHALILSICANCILQKSNFNNEICNKLSNDLKELYRLLFSNTISLEWIGQIILRIFLDDKDTKIFPNIFLENSFNNNEIFLILQNKFSLKLNIIYSILYSKIQSILNSAPSCFHHELHDYLDLFENFLSSSEIISNCDNNLRIKFIEERNLIHMIQFIRLLNKSEEDDHHHTSTSTAAATTTSASIDFIPLKLRILSPLEVAKQILKSYPNSYLLAEDGQFYQGKKFESLLHATGTVKSWIGGEQQQQQEEEVEDQINDSLTRQYYLSQKIISGKYFIHVFSSNSQFILPSLYIEVIRTALQQGYIIDAIDLLLDLVHQDNLQDSSSPPPTSSIMTIIQEIFDLLDDLPMESSTTTTTTTTTNSMMTITGSSDSITNLIQKLKNQIIFSFITNCSKEELQPSYFMKSTHQSSPTLSLNEEEDNTTNNTNNNDYKYLENAKIELWKTIGEILYKPCSLDSINNPICSVQEIVTSSSISTTTSHVLGFLLLIHDENLINNLFDSILRDLKSKIAKSVKFFGKKQYSDPMTSVIPLESLVSQVQAKGFHRNSALRAVFATKNESLESALKWAIEHSNDSDFTEPMIINSLRVSGALRQADGPSISIESLNRAVEVVSSIHQTYLLACPNRSSSSVITKQISDSQLPEINPPEGLPSEEMSIHEVPSQFLNPVLKSEVLEPSNHDALTELSTATILISNLENLLHSGAEYLNTGIDTQNLARSLVYWDDKELDENKRQNIEEEFISYLTDLSTKTEAPVSLFHDILTILPSSIKLRLSEILPIQHEEYLNPIISKLQLTPSTIDIILQHLEETLTRHSCDVVEKIQKIFIEKRIISMFAMQDTSNTSNHHTGKTIKETKNESITFLEKFPFRLFNLLRLAYLHTNGIQSDDLLRIKSMTLDFFTNILNESTTSSVMNTPLSDIKTILQDEVATIKRIIRVQPSNINMKVILQSDDLLPSRFIPDYPFRAYTRPMVLKEISHHLTNKNINQWNRTIGRLLETGLSELGLHFCLERLCDLSKVLMFTTSGPTSEDINFDVIEFVKDISGIILKLRDEHFHLFILYLSTLPYTSDNSTFYLHIDETLYPTHLHPLVIQQILSEFIQIITKEGINSKEIITHDITTTTTATKMKTIVKKIDSEQPSDDHKGDATAKDNLPKVQFLHKIFDYTTLFLLLPSNYHQDIRQFYQNPLQSIREYCLNVFLSYEITPPMFYQVCSIYYKYYSSFNNQNYQFPSNEILISLQSDLLFNQIHDLPPAPTPPTPPPPRPPYSLELWDVLLQKIQFFLELTLMNNENYWNNFIDSLLIFENEISHQRSLEEVYLVFVHRYAAYQSLSQLSSSSSFTLKYSFQQLENYFQTHIFLLSPDILQVLQLHDPTDRHDPSNRYSLPYPFHYFTSSNNLNELFLLIKTQLYDNYHSRNILDQSSKVIMILVHILRIWEGRASPTSRQESLRSLFEWWTHRSCSNEDHSSYHSLPWSPPLYINCYLTVLELSSSLLLEEIFLDILLLDLLPPYPTNQILIHLQFLPVTVFKMIENFQKPFIAWIRLYLTAYFHGASTSSNELQDISSDYLDLIEITNTYQNNFYLSLLLLLHISPSLYRNKLTIFSSLLLTSFQWLENRFQPSPPPFLLLPILFSNFMSRIDACLVQSTGNISPSITQWDTLLVYQYFQDLSSSKSNSLPMILSPLSLVYLLRNENYLIDASMIYWKILQLPQHAYRDDLAFEILKTSTDSNSLPYYFDKIPEVESHQWGWQSNK